MVKSQDKKINAQAIENESFSDSPGGKTDIKNKQAVSSAPSRSIGTKKPSIKKLQEEIEKLRKENSEMKDQLLRKMAEFDNFRKRTEREYGELFARAGEDIVQKLLPILDDLERSLSQPDDDNHKGAFRQGIELIYSKSLKTLQDAGLKPIETDDKEFDPNVHEAMLQVENPDVPSNHIVETFEKGYYFNGRVIRHAKVSVSK